MTTSPVFKDLAKPLLDFGEIVGISEAEWARSEETERLLINIPDLPRERVRGLSLEPLQQLADMYGDALICQFLHGKLPILEVHSDIRQEEVRDFELELRANRQLRLRLRLDKTKLLQRFIGERPQHNFVLYLFDRALVEQIEGPLAGLEEQWWGEEESRKHKVIILAPGHADLKLDGDYISVLGGAQTDEWQKALRTQDPSGDVTSMYRICRAILHWQEQWLDFLTPLHLMHGPAAADPIADCLRVQLANLIILFTADQTVAAEQGKWSATYVGERRSMQLNYGPACLQLDQAKREGLAGLSGMMRWAYRPLEVEDRLAVVQIGIIDALYSTPPDYKFRLLLSQGAGIWHDVLRFWKGFIENKVGDYSAAVKAIEDDVVQTSQAYNRQISDMVKSLSGAMLAAVGVVLGSFIVAMFRDPFNPTIFVFGILLYAVYVFFFPLLYNMLNQWSQYKQITASFDTRRERYNEKLSSEVVGEIIGDQVCSSQQRYKIWYIATVIAYLIFIGSILFLMVLVVVGPLIYSAVLGEPAS